MSQAEDQDEEVRAYLEWIEQSAADAAEYCAELLRQQVGMTVREGMGIPALRESIRYTVRVARATAELEAWNQVQRETRAALRAAGEG